LIIFTEKRIISKEMLKNTEHIRRLLDALGEKMEFRNCRPIGLIVCGGAALHIHGLIDRVTIDVDVVALGAKQGGVVVAYQAARDFPVDMQDCIAEVSEDFGLDAPQWVNTGPRDLFVTGLPDGAEQRLTCEEFGSRLSIYWMGRVDLVCLKLYAAAGHSGRLQQHRDDLNRLRPTYEELDRAIRWTLMQKSGQKDFEVFKQDLKRLLCDMGYEDHAYYIA